MSTQPQYLQPGLEPALQVVRRALYRAGLTDAEARTRAYGVYQDYMSAVEGRHTAETLEAYAERIGRGEF